MSDRPNLGIIELELASLFGTGIAMSSWTWTSNTLQTWQKLWRRLVMHVQYNSLMRFRIVCMDVKACPQPKNFINFCHRWVSLLVMLSVGETLCEIYTIWQKCFCSTHWLVTSCVSSSVCDSSSEYRWQEFRE